MGRQARRARKITEIKFKKISEIDLMKMTPKPLKIKEDSKPRGTKNGITSESFGGTGWKGTQDNLAVAVRLSGYFVVLYGVGRFSCCSKVWVGCRGSCIHAGLVYCLLTGVRRTVVVLRGG